MWSWWPEQEPEDNVAGEPPRSSAREGAGSGQTHSGRRLDLYEQGGHRDEVRLRERLAMLAQATTGRTGPDAGTIAIEDLRLRYGITVEDCGPRNSRPAGFGKSPDWHRAQFCRSTSFVCIRWRAEWTLRSARTMGRGSTNIFGWRGTSGSIGS